MVYNNSFRNQENQPADAVRDPLPRVEAYKNDSLDINVNIYDSLQGQCTRENSSVQDEKQIKSNQSLKAEEKPSWESKTCQTPSANGCLENQTSSRRGNYVLANIGYSTVLRSEVEAINQARYNYNLPLPPGFVRPPPPPFRPIPSNQVYVQVPAPPPPIPRSFYLAGNNQNLYQDPKNKDFPPLKPSNSEEKCCSHVHLHQGNISFAPPYIYPHWKPTSFNPPSLSNSHHCNPAEKQYYIVENPLLQPNNSSNMNITDKPVHNDAVVPGGLPDNTKPANFPNYSKYPPFVRMSPNDPKPCIGLLKEPPLPDFGCFYEGTLTSHPSSPDNIPITDPQCDCNAARNDALTRSLTPVHIGGLLTLPKAEDEAEKLNPSNPKEVLSGSSSPRDPKKQDYSILREDVPITELVVRGCTVIEKIVTHYNIKSSNVDIKKFSKTVRIGLASRKNVIQIETLIRELILAFLHIASSWVSMRSFLSVSIENQTILENCVDPLAGVFHNWKVASRVILERMITSLQNICVEHEKYMPELCKKRGQTHLLTCPDGNSDGNESDSTAGSTMAWSSSDSDHVPSDDSLKGKEEKDSKLRPKNRKSSDEETVQPEPAAESNVYPLHNPENEKSKSTTFVPPARLSKMWASPKRRQNNSSYMFNNFSSYTPHSQKSLCYGNRSKEGSVSNRDISRDTSKSFYDKYHSTEIKPNEMWRKPVMEEPQKSVPSSTGNNNNKASEPTGSYRTPSRTYKDVIQQGLNGGREKGPEWKSAVESSVETLSNILKKSPPPPEKTVNMKTTGLKYSDACSGRLEEKISQNTKNERKPIYLSRNDVEGEWRKTNRKELKSMSSQTDEWKPSPMNKDYSGLVMHSDTESTSEKCEPLLLPKNSEVHPVDVNVKYKILDILGFIQSSNLEGFLEEELAEPIVTKLKETVLYPLFNMSYWVYNDVYSNLMDLLDEIYAIFFKARCVNKGNIEVMLTVSKMEMKLIQLLHNELNTC